MRAPAIVLLLLWIFVPLAITPFYRFMKNNLPNPASTGFATWLDYTEPAFGKTTGHIWVLAPDAILITVVGALLFAMMIDKPVFRSEPCPNPVDLTLLRHDVVCRAHLGKHGLVETRFLLTPQGGRIFTFSENGLAIRIPPAQSHHTSSIGIKEP